MGAIANRYRNQAIIAPDTMVLMHHEVARGQRGQFGQKCIRRLATLLTPHQTVAKHVLLAQHHKVGRGVAMVKREHDHCGLASGNAQGLLPALRLNDWRCFVVRQQAFQAFTCAKRIAGNYGLRFGLVKRFQMRGDRFVDIHFLRALGRKVARRANAEINDTAGVRLCKWRYEMRCVVREQLVKFSSAKIQHFGRKRTVASGFGCLRLHPVFVIIRDRVETRLPRGNGTTIADDERVRTNMVEYGRHALFEQRQPMVHARKSAAFGNGLI